MANKPNKKSADNMTELQQLGSRIRSLRIAKGYSNFEFFAYENRIPRAQYNRYERGEDLRFSSLVKVINGLGMTLSEFFAEGFEQKPEESTDKSPAAQAL